MRGNILNYSNVYDLNKTFPIYLSEVNNACSLQHIYEFSGNYKI